MSKQNLYPKTGNRIKELLRICGISQAELARRLPGNNIDGQVSTIHINQLANGHKKLTPDMAQRIVDAFPGAGIKASWLLGLDDYMTDAEQIQAKSDAFREELDSQDKNSMIIRQSVAAMMRLQGIAWNGEKGNYNYKDAAEIGLDLPQTVTFRGLPFRQDELSRIAHKVYDLLTIELDYAVREKESSLPFDKWLERL